VPKEDLIFDDLECENFYKIYVHEVGFSVRKSSCEKDKGVEKFKYFVYSKQGFKETSTSDNCKGKEKVCKQGRDVMLWLCLKGLKMVNIFCTNFMRDMHIYLPHLESVTC